MKSATIRLVVILLCCSGCIYKGNINENFIHWDSDTSKLPLIAYLVFDNTIENSVYSARNVMLWHGVDIETKPGLRAAIYSAFSSVFEELYTDNCIEKPLTGNYDVIIITGIEFSGDVVIVSATLKEAANDKVINSYTTTEKIHHNVQISLTSDTLHAISTVPPLAAITSPFFVMYMTDDVGKQAKMDLEGSLRRALSTITEDIQKDQLLLARFGKKN